LALLRCWLLCMLVQAAPACLAAGEVTAFAAEQTFASPEAAWQARASFRKVTQAPAFLGWAKGPRWVWLQAPPDECPQASTCFVYFGAPPVARFEAWSINAQSGSATLLTSGGAAVPTGDADRHASPRVVIPWSHGSDSVLVRFDPIATAVIDPRLIDATDLNRIARQEGWIAGTIICLLVLALIFHAHSIYTKQSRADIERLGIILTASIWILVFNLFADQALAGWSSIAINRLISGLLALILILINFQIIDIFNIHEEPKWINIGLRVITLTVIPSCFIGEILWGSSLQGLMTNAGFQAPVVLAAVVIRHLKGDPDASRLIGLGVLQVVTLELHIASAWGVIPYSWLLHNAWKGCLGLGILVAFWDGWMGNQLERRLTQARKERLQKLLLEEKQKLEVRVDERTNELQIALTELRHMEEQQRRLLALASHEFRTPATIIKSSLDVLDVLPESTSEMGKAQLSILRNASARLTFLANNLIDHERWREMSVKPQFQHLNLCAWLNTFAAESPPNLNLITHIPTEPLYVLCDVVLLRIALQNLIDNAIIHSKANRPVTLHLMSTRDQASIVVDDQGAGVPDEYKASVFDRFFSSVGHGFGQTHGLGLSIVKSVMQLHHGHASCDDAPGGGARFTLILPRSDLP
jgi:signal transduction histidine kinase